MKKRRLDDVDKCIRSFFLLFSRRRDVDAASLASRLKLVGDGHVVAKETISWHLSAHNSCQDGPSVQPDSHLKQKMDHEKKALKAFSELTLMCFPS
jgi:hypothetical protein